MLTEETIGNIKKRLLGGFSSDEIIEALGHEYSSDAAWMIRGIEGFHAYVDWGFVSPAWTTDDHVRWRGGWATAARLEGLHKVRLAEIKVGTTCPDCRFKVGDWHVRGCSLLKGAAPDALGLPHYMADSLLPLCGAGEDPGGYKATRTWSDVDCDACLAKKPEAQREASESLRVVLDAIADLGCISSVTVDEDAWKALGGMPDQLRWRGLKVRLLYPGGAVVAQWDIGTGGDPDEPPELIHEKLPQPSGDGGWLLRPLPGSEGLPDRGVAARHNPAGFWALADRNRPAQHGDLLALQWGGDIFGTSLVRAEEYLARTEGREPIPVEQLHELWTVEEYAELCARPREGGQEFVPFCEIVRVDNDGREVSRLPPDPAECGCCGAMGDTPCDDDCDSYRQGALQ